MSVAQRSLASASPSKDSLCSTRLSGNHSHAPTRRSRLARSRSVAAADALRNKDHALSLCRQAPADARRTLWTRATGCAMRLALAGAIAASTIVGTSLGRSRAARSLAKLTLTRTRHRMYVRSLVNCRLRCCRKKLVFARLFVIVVSMLRMI